MGSIRFATQLGSGDVLELADRLRLAGGATFEYRGPFGCGPGLPVSTAELAPGERRGLRYPFRLTAAPDGTLSLEVVAPSTFGQAPFVASVAPGELRIAYVLDETAGADESWKGAVRREVVVHVDR